MAETGLKLRTAAPSGDWRSFIGGRALGWRHQGPNGPHP